MFEFNTRRINITNSINLLNEYSSCLHINEKVVGKHIKEDFDAAEPEEEEEEENIEWAVGDFCRATFGDGKEYEAKLIKIDGNNGEFWKRGDVDVEGNVESLGFNVVEAKRFDELKFSEGNAARLKQICDAAGGEYIPAARVDLQIGTAIPFTIKVFEKVTDKADIDEKDEVKVVCDTDEEDGK